MLPAHGLSNNSDTSQLNSVFGNFNKCESTDLEKGIYIWTFCGLVGFIFGFPAALTIVLEMFKMWKRGAPITPNNFFILNLSIMDALFLFFIPLEIVNNYMLMSWDFESVCCGFYALNHTGRPFLMACVCLDCYFAVVHPIAYHKRKSLTPRVVMAGMVWIVTVTIGSLYTVSFYIYFSIFSFVPFFISIIIIGICDSLILFKLVQSHHRETIHPQKQRAIHILINSLVMTVVSYLPSAILFALVIYGKVYDKSFRCTVLILGTITSTLVSAIMPILYLNNIGKLEHFKLACCSRS